VGKGYLLFGVFGVVWGERGGGFCLVGLGGGGGGEYLLIFVLSALAQKP